MNYYGFCEHCESTWKLVLKFIVIIIFLQSLVWLSLKGFEDTQKKII